MAESIDELMAQIPMGQLAGQLGVSEGEAEQAVRSALPALLGGMQANAQDPAGEASLARALGQHDGSLLEGGVDLDRVDTDDGQKIVRNIFGDNEGAVVQQLGGAGGGLGGGLMAKLLPMLAPLLLSYLGKSLGGGSRGSSADRPSAGSGGSGMGPGSSTRSDAGDDSGGGGGLGDILGGLLGGGGGGDGGGGGLGGLGDVLGGLLGGGKR